MKFLLVLFVAVTFLAIGEALDCYHCTSDDQGCGEPFDKSGSGVKKLTCNDESRSCVRIIRTIPNGSRYVTRYCATGPEVCKANTRSKTECFACSTNLCNGVSATGAALSMLMVLAVPLVFGHYY